jgi:hypothetical protein
LHPAENITNVEIAVFLRALLRHLRGQVIVLLDRGSIDKGPDVQALEARCPRLHLEWFPGYVPELNPADWVWAQFKAELGAQFKAELANGHPEVIRLWIERRAYGAPPRRVHLLALCGLLVALQATRAPCIWPWAGPTSWRSCSAGTRWCSCSC